MYVSSVWLHLGSLLSGCCFDPVLQNENALFIFSRSSTLEKVFHESNNRFLPINFIQLWFLYNKSSTIKNSRTLVRNFLISNIYLNESACFRNEQCWSDWNHDFLNKNLKALLVDLLKYLLKSEMENGELFNGGLNGRLSVLKEMERWGKKFKEILTLTYSESQEFVKKDTNYLFKNLFLFLVYQLQLYSSFCCGLKIFKTIVRHAFVIFFLIIPVSSLKLNFSQTSEF